MPPPYIELAHIDVRSHCAPGFRCWRCPPIESLHVCPILRQAVRLLINYAEMADHDTQGWSAQW